jgi:hydrogenase maturation protease
MTAKKKSDTFCAQHPPGRPGNKCLTPFSPGWPRPIRVVGLGSPLGDDALAWEVVDRLRKLRRWPDEVEFHALASGQRLLDVVDGRGSLVLIDALTAGKDPGDILQFPWPAPGLEVLRPGSTHTMRPAEALLVAASLGLLPAQVTIWGIEGNCFSPNAPISPAVLAAIPELVNQVSRQLQTCHA